MVITINMTMQERPEEDYYDLINHLHALCARLRDVQAVDIVTDVPLPAHADHIVPLEDL